MAVLKGGCLAKRKHKYRLDSFGVSFLYCFGYRFGRRYFLTKLGLVECHDGNDINLLHLAAQIVKKTKHSKAFNKSVRAHEMHGHKHMLV